MTDHAEEQEMEAEALAAIFDTLFSIEAPQTWSVELYPETGDPSELDELNHVACKLLVKIPPTYPDEALPELEIELIKGLSDEHQVLLQELAVEEAEANQGVPSIFAIAERVREWLAEHNVTGLDDTSMYAQMLRKQQEAKKQQEQSTAAFEAQKQQEEMSSAEAEELAVRKRRAEGTPCNKENFLAWQQRFEAEQLELKQQQEQEKHSLTGKKKSDDVGINSSAAKEKRITGYDYFSSKATNLEALELAAEQAENDSEEEEEEDLEDVDEDLFDDDVDLDDLDFDDDDDDEDLDI